MIKKLVHFSMKHPKAVVILTLIVTAFFAFQLPKIKIDTDPENMLSPNEPVRIAHRDTKAAFSLYDMLVVGIVEEGPEGVFKPETLERIARITDEIMMVEGVIIADVISPTTTDDIQVKDGVLNIDKLVLEIPKTLEDATRIKNAALDNPLLKNMLISEDGKAIALYIPIESKDISYRVSQELKEIIERNKGEEKYYITGLPVAEDTFGVEMFKQMAISAPLSGLIIFILMFLFFRRFSLVASPMIVAMVSVLWAMGALIGLGYTVHIMSSMIPIFLMPIAVVDSIHILSEFHDRYQIYKDRKKTIEMAMDELMTPMFYTSLTSATGFASLALTPIPPVKVFGLFVAFGILTAWFLTVTFIPAYTMLMKEESLKDFGMRKGEKSLFARFLPSIGSFATKNGKLIILAGVVVYILSFLGINRIVINDNPVRWFQEGHRIRVADTVLNRHFGGTYMAYLVLKGTKPDLIKEPELMAYIEKLQTYLNGIDVVGKTTSVTDIVKKIGYELHDEDRAYDMVPDDRNTIAQYLFLYEMSGDPQDLYHLVDYDFREANIWIQMRGGDNRDMLVVEDAVETFIRQNPIPEGASLRWAGLTYVNKVWQEKMVGGMLKALLGAFLVILVILTVLFRSPLWGILCMASMGSTIAIIYGVIGFIGKEYDMPVAVLSSLAMGLSIDFDIHMAGRARAIYKRVGDWQETVKELFGEPVRAISRNAVVIAVGFLPLLAAPLVPYQTVGLFIFSIMAISGVTTLFLTTALITIFRGRLFKI
jgi:predicted RND superfamily exporter protein